MHQVPRRGARPRGGAESVVGVGAARAGAERSRPRRTTPLLREIESAVAISEGTLKDHAVPLSADVEDPAVKHDPEQPDDAPESTSLNLGRPGDDLVIEHQIASAMEFVRRRLTGDYTIDEFGFDEEFNEQIALGMLRMLYRRWFRVEVRGIENIPDTGGALIVANHSGTLALDALMTLVAVHDEHPAQRHLRMLGADLVFKAPVLGSLARKVGVTLAAHDDAERLLRGGHLVGVWPEGFKGIGKPFSERYKLQRFGRGGFVSAAIRTRTPIIPCSIVGAEEIYPILGTSPLLARIFGLPFWPITPTWPWLGPLGLVPLPSKWMIEFGAPIYSEDYPEGSEDDPMVVFDLTDRVRETIQETLYSLLVARRHVFF